MKAFKKIGFPMKKRLSKMAMDKSMEGRNSIFHNRESGKFVKETEGPFWHTRRVWNPEGVRKKFSGTIGAFGKTLSIQRGYYKKGEKKAGHIKFSKPKKRKLMVEEP